MKGYVEAIRSAARHQVYMERSLCFKEHELGNAHMVRVATIADIYDRDYDWVEFELRRQEHIQRSTVNEWYDEYCESIAEEG